jgi:hypothetical protein
LVIELAEIDMSKREAEAWKSFISRQDDDVTLKYSKLAERFPRRFIFAKTDSRFGFFDRTKPASEQRYGGWGIGRWASQKEFSFLAKHRASEIARPTGLQKHEADIALAARSFGSVVLTLDKKNSALRDALNQGGNVVYLNDFDASGFTLAEFIRLAIEKAN